MCIRDRVESALQRTTDTKALVIGVGTLPRTAEMFNELFPGCRAVVVADTNTWRVAGGEVHRILADAGIGQDEPHVFADPKLYAEWSFVEELDGVLAATDAVPVAVGSGVINDLTKLDVYKRQVHRGEFDPADGVGLRVPDDREAVFGDIQYIGSVCDAYRRRHGGLGEGGGRQQERAQQ